VRSSNSLHNAHNDSWHADIKTDNILLVGGKFKLADPGFARFEKANTKKTVLQGGTVTYGTSVTAL
jgi:tRNA A-37 threonylcarbamoyl transferase component Bud32